MSCVEAPIARSGVESGSALEEGSARWEGKGAPDAISTIWMFELEFKEEGRLVKPASAFTTPGIPTVSTDLREIEAEFFRMTGIMPDPILRGPEPVVSAPKAQAIGSTSLFFPPSRAVASSVPDKAAKPQKDLSSKSKRLKEKILSEYLE